MQVKLDWWMIQFPVKLIRRLFPLLMLHNQHRLLITIIISSSTLGALPYEYNSIQGVPYVIGSEATKDLLSNAEAVEDEDEARRPLELRKAISLWEKSETVERDGYPRKST